MEAVHQCDYDIPLGFLAVLVKAVLPCNLDCTLISFSTRVSKEHLAVTSDATEFLSKISLYLCVVVVGGVLYLLYLCANRIYPFLVAVAKAVCADTRAKIYVLFAVFADSCLFGTLIEYQVIPSVGRHNVFIELFYSVHFHFPFR